MILVMLAGLLCPSASFSQITWPVDASMRMALGAATSGPPIPQFQIRLRCRRRKRRTHQNCQCRKHRRDPSHSFSPIFFYIISIDPHLPKNVRNILPPPVTIPLDLCYTEAINIFMEIV